jgi:hypothetical protein
VVVAALLLVLGGCHTPLLRTTSEAELARADRYQLIAAIDLPATHGHEGCAAAALAAILAYHDPGLDPVALAAELPWHDEGASPVEVLLEARRRGFAATIERGDWQRLSALAAAGQPCLVMIDAGPEMQTLTRSVPLVPAMHWAVFSGVARDGTAALLAARRARHHVVIASELMRRWSASDYCLIVVERAGRALPYSQGRNDPGAAREGALVHPGRSGHVAAAGLLAGGGHAERGAGPLLVAAGPPARRAAARARLAAGG